VSFRNRSKPGNPSKVVLPITPMLDMTFQLLFFFIVNFKATPTLQEGQLEMALPSEQATSNPNNQVERPKGNDPDIVFPADVTVKVRTQLVEGNAGFISALAVSVNEKEEQVDGGLKGLKAVLEAKREGLSQKDNIKVQGDGKLKVKEMMKVMDVCRQAGFTNVSMVPPEDFGR
jgi:biopolymer transport protein ExbD